MICKDFLKGNCAKEVCPLIHERSLYPCASLYGVGYCENMNNCPYSHEKFRTERDIEEFIRDNEQYLLDIYRTRKESILGYYFIKYLHNLRDRDRRRFDSLKIQLPVQMPSYVAPKMIGRDFHSSKKLMTINRFNRGHNFKPQHQKIVFFL